MARVRPARPRGPTSMSVVVLGQLAGLIEVTEPSVGIEGALVVVGEV